MSKPARYKWEDISDILSMDGYMQMEVGKVLIFAQPDGSKRNFKVMRVTPTKVWVREITLYRPEDIEVIDKKPPKS